MRDKKDAYVKNASDEKQVKRSSAMEKIGRDQELDDVKAVMGTECGRRFVWRLLEKCETFGSVARPNYGDTYYVSGKQDVGHYVMAEIAEADEMVLGKLMIENFNKGAN